MVKKSWFSSVKKSFSPDSEEKKAKDLSKSKKKWFGKESQSVSETPNLDSIEISYPHSITLLEDLEMIQSLKHDSSVAEKTIVADEDDEPEVLPPSSEIKFLDKSEEEEVAAIKIQTAFRGFMARRALRALKGLVRLKSLVDGPIVHRQTVNTMKCLQTLSRVQCQIQSRRMRFVEENQALQRQLLLKPAKELESFKMGEGWDDSLHSKEQIKASLLFKYEATMRRERALAYSYTHQLMWKKSKSSSLLFMDPANPHWGWSWFERWIAPQPLEEKDLNSSSPATSSFKPALSSVRGRKLKPTSSKVITSNQDDDDSRSLHSIEPLRNRRHSITGLSIKDEILGSSASGPGYMASTKSAKAKSKLIEALVMDKGSVKKRLSFPPSPGKPSEVDSFPVVAGSM